MSKRLGIVGSSGEQSLEDKGYDLVMVVDRQHKFIGKRSKTAFKVDEETGEGSLTLKDVIEAIGFMSPEGYVIAGNLLGDMEHCPFDEMSVISIDKKSPYYEAYYKTTSGITASNKPAGH